MSNAPVFRFRFGLLLLLLGFGLVPEQARAQMVRVETKVENFTTTQFLVGCPSYGGDPAFVMDLMNVEVTDAQVEPLLDAINEFEAENGVRLTSRSETRNFKLKLDNIQTVARGPLSGAGKNLCDLLKTLQK